MEVIKPQAIPAGREQEWTEDNSKPFKEVILDLFEQVRQANARIAKKERIAEENDSLFAILTEKLDIVLDN